MRCLFINHSHWPEKSGYLFGTIIDNLLIDRNNIELFTYYPNDCDKEDFEKLNKKNLKIFRFKLINKFITNKIIKFVNSSIFCLKILIYGIIRKKYDYIICTCSHLLFVGFISSIIAKFHNARFIYCIGDLHPESGIMSGDFKNKYIIKFIKYFDTRACQDAFRIIVLSKDMKNNVQLRSGCRNKKILIIPNVPHYITSQLDDADKPEILTKNPSKFRIVYTGNIGRFQGLETIMEAMQNLDENIELIFLGNGVYQNKIIKNYSDLIGKSVIMLPSNDINYVNSLINSADIGLVSLLDGVEKCAFPSKMSGYLNMNCPILVIASKGSEIYKMTSDYKIGISVDHSDPKKVSDLISKISTTNDFKISYKSSIIKFMNKYYLKENIVNSWKNLLNNFDD